MKSSIAVRFAPSPTGPLHIGGVRTALYNYLFAKQHQGRFILRIEDTDRTRYVPGAEEYIIEALRWVGIEFNEGVSIGGDYGPYRQSDRAKAGIYQQYADQLLQSGHAYYAFDTPEELDAMRVRLKAEGSSVQQYNYLTRGQMNNSLSLTQEEVQQRLDAGEPYVVRMRMPEDETISFQDIVREEVSFHTANLDDKILVKGDGMPTYHLANVVDDHLMEISHVIRAEEWISSTPLHVALYRAFGWEDSMPHFVHLPVLLKSFGKGKLSKRDSADGLIDDLAKKILKKIKKSHPDISQTDEARKQLGLNISHFVMRYRRDIQAARKELSDWPTDSPIGLATQTLLSETFFSDRGLNEKDKGRLATSVFPLNWLDPRTDRNSPGLREDGFQPDAVLNFLVLLGWHPGTEEEIMDMSKMIDSFGLDRVHKAGAKYEQDKLLWFNETYLRARDGQEILSLLQPHLQAAGITDKSDAYLLVMIELLRERVSMVQEFVSSGKYFFEAPSSYDPKVVKKRWKADSPLLLTALSEAFAGIDVWKKDPLHQAFQELLAEKEVGAGKIMAPLRLALTGVAGGPGVFEIAELIGKEETIKRLNAAISALSM
ncbi:MAG: glutamate--tRNA ligase [Bacteroidota bacterium]